MTNIQKPVLLLGASLLAINVSAKDMSTAELAKKSQNPVANLISLPIENDLNVNTGPYDRNQNIFEVKPVIPVQINKDWNLINRVIVPFISQPTGESDRENGLGDITYQAFFSPVTPGKFIWGVGPQLQLPTHSKDALGSTKWAAGPAVVGLTMTGPWVVGGVISNIWSVGGALNEPDINLMTAQPFINYNFGNTGWYVTTSPVITANWEADNKNRWTIPVGGGVGKLVHWGKLPVNIKLAYYNYVDKPETGSDYDVQLAFTFLFPK